MFFIDRAPHVRDGVAILGVTFLAAAALQPFQNTPFIDDWVYAWSVEQLLREGRLQLLDFSVHLNVAQPAVRQPDGAGKLRHGECGSRAEHRVGSSPPPFLDPLVGKCFKLNRTPLVDPVSSHCR
jgi:hypothetical protein